MICNIATYKFVSIENLSLLKICRKLKVIAKKNAIKGTILLSTEGINLSLAGEKKAIKIFQDTLNQDPLFADLHYNYSYSDLIPFKKLCVKIKKEIVTFKREEIHPEAFTAPYITPEQFQQWHDQNREMIILDARNKFEYEIGTFQKAIHLNINSFQEFPEASCYFSSLEKNKPVVTFCTGGIRCEKAAAYLLTQGFQEVYQLQGGILNYFKQCGNRHFQGNCFVFDDRIALNSRLEIVE